MSAAGIPSSVGVRTARLRDGQQRSARTRNTSLACKLLFLLILVVMSAGCVRSASGATFVGVGDNSAGSKTYTEASKMCTEAGMTLPVIDSAAKNDELVSFIAATYSWTSDNYAFLSGGITSECGNGFAAVGCFVYRTEQNGTQTNIAKMTSGTTSVPINGAYTNFADVLLAGNVYLTIGKSGKWSAAYKTGTVTSVICENKPVPAAITSQTKSGLGTGPIVGIVIGSIAGLIILLVIIIVVHFKRKEKKKKEKEKQRANENVEEGVKIHVRGKLQKGPRIDIHGNLLSPSVSGNDLPRNPLTNNQGSGSEGRSGSQSSRENERIEAPKLVDPREPVIPPMDLFMQCYGKLLNYREALGVFQSLETRESKYDFLLALQSETVKYLVSDMSYYNLIAYGNWEDIPEELGFLTRGDQLFVELTATEPRSYSHFTTRSNLTINDQYLNHMYRIFMFVKQQEEAAQNNEAPHREGRKRRRRRH